MIFDIPNQQHIIDFYGDGAQALVHSEECSELIQAISKNYRVRSNPATIYERELAHLNLIEEIADVLVCIEQMMEIHKISEAEIQGFIYRKCARQVDRLREYQH